MTLSNDVEKRVESKAEAEALIPLFRLEQVMNQDQGGRRITLLGSIHSQPALLTLERAAFPSDPVIITNFLTGLANTTNLGANDVYRWYMSNHHQRQQQLGSSSSVSASSVPAPPDLKLNLIYPCTQTHIRKYTVQKLRYVTETAEVYKSHVRPYIARTQRTPARLDWIYNILDGITEQEDVVYRSPDFGGRVSGDNRVESEPQDGKGGFILLPDLNWDRKTVTGLHLLALVERRNVWSFRDLKKSDAVWLRGVRDLAVREAARYGSELAKKEHGDSSDPVDMDMLKCYVHYHPTYYHFHVHVVHVMLEAEGTTQSVGKAINLDALITQLEYMAGVNEEKEGQEMGMDQIDVSYFIGEESEIWKKCFARLKTGERVDLND